MLYLSSMHPPTLFCIVWWLDPFVIKLSRFGPSGFPITSTTIIRSLYVVLAVKWKLSCGMLAKTKIKMKASWMIWFVFSAKKTQTGLATSTLGSYNQRPICRHVRIVFCWLDGNKICLSAVDVNNKITDTVQTHKAVLRLVPRLADVISRNSASFFTKMPK